MADAAESTEDEAEIDDKVPNKDTTEDGDNVDAGDAKETSETKNDEIKVNDDGDNEGEDMIKEEDDPRLQLYLQAALEGIELLKMIIHNGSQAGYMLRQARYEQLAEAHRLLAGVAMEDAAEAAAAEATAAEAPEDVPVVELSSDSEQEAEQELVQIAQAQPFLEVEDEQDRQALSPHVIVERNWADWNFPFLTVNHFSRFNTALEVEEMRNRLKILFADMPPRQREVRQAMRTICLQFFGMPDGSRSWLKDEYTLCGHKKKHEALRDTEFYHCLAEYLMAEYKCNRKTVLDAARAFLKNF